KASPTGTRRSTARSREICLTTRARPSVMGPGRGSRSRRSCSGSWRGARRSSGPRDFPSGFSPRSPVSPLVASLSSSPQSSGAWVLAAALLFGVPQFIAWSRLAMTDVPLVALGLLAILLVLCGKEQPIFTIAAGAAFGLAFLAKSVAAFLFAPGLVALIVARQ